MTVGILELQLRLDGCRSLKDKRQILHSLIERCRNRFHVSIAEVEDQELWNVSTIGVCCVSGNASFAESVMQKVSDFVAAHAEVQIESEERRIETY